MQSHGLRRKRLRVALSGTVDARAVADLRAFVDAVHAEAEHRSCSEVLFEIDNVVFMSSACLKTIADWLGKIARMPVQDQYMVRFRSNVDAYWQERAVAAFQALSSNVARE